MGLGGGAFAPCAPHMDPPLPADCWISLKFGTLFDHVTVDTQCTTKVQGQVVKGQLRSQREIVV